MEGHDGVGLPVLNGSNYSHWKLKMRRILEAKELDEVVYGDAAKPTIGAEGALVIPAGFKRKDARAAMHLINALDEKHLSIVEACATARDVWNRLELEYADKEPVSLEGLLTEFYTFKKKPGQSVSEYVAHIEKMALKLSQLNKPLEKEAIMAKITTGLSSEFVNFKRSWDMTPKEFKSMELLVSNLKKEEASLNESGAVGGALLAMGRNQGDKSTSRFRRGRGEDMKKNSQCRWCNQPGHWWKECPSRPADQKPANLGQRRAGRDKPGNRQQGFQQAKHQQPNHQQGTSQQGAPMIERAMCATSGDKSSDDLVWYVDSGASSHMTCHSEWLEDYQSLIEPYPVQVANGEYIYAIGKGSVRVVSQIGDREHVLRFMNVYYIPKMSNNLFSIKSAGKTGVDVTFTGDSVIIKHGTEVLAKGSMAPVGLYKLDVYAPMQARIARSERTLDEWHAVLGHADSNKIREMARNNSANGFKIVDHAKRPGEGCGGCQTGKGHAASHPESSRPRATEIMERIHMDLVGPINPASVGGSRYFLLIRDEFSTYLFVEFLQSKAEVANILKRFVDKISTMTQARVKIMRSDQGSEFKNSAVQMLCEMEGIVQEFSAVYTPQQNGEAERANRTVLDAARSFLTASSLPNTIWAEAVNCAVHVRNRIANSRTGTKTPYELFYGRKPSLDRMMPFGQPVQILDHTRGRLKFDARTTEAFMVGYDSRPNTYRCLKPNLVDIEVTPHCVPADHSTRREEPSHQHVNSIFIIEPEPHVCSEQLIEQPNETTHKDPPPPRAPSRNDTFIIESGASPAGPSHRENLISYPHLTREAPGPPSGLDEPVQQAPQQGEQGGGQQFMETARRMFTTNSLQEAQQILNPRTSRVQTSRAERAPLGRGTTFVGPPREQTTTAQAPSRPVSLQRSATVHVTPTPQSSAGLKAHIGAVMNNLLGSKSKTPMKNFMAVLNVLESPEPLSFAEAISCREHDAWFDAIKAELDAHSKNQTWSIVVKPEGAHEITAKWIFKKKLAPDGQVERFKARLVARGFSQVAGLDYFEIFAPVVRMDSIRLLFALAAQSNLMFYQFDIATAFLNGIIEEELYLKPPEGVEVPAGHTLKLNRSLYGLKQSPRCWNKRLKELVRGFNMEPTSADPCVFVRTRGEALILALYVDDGLLFAKGRGVIDEFVNYLNKHVQINEVKSSCFVGVEIVRSPEGSIFLHQRSYIKRMLERFNMSDSKPKATPLDLNHPLNKEEVLREPIIEGNEYAAAIGSLMYCCVATRPDLSYALSVLSKHTKAPREAHWQGVKRVFRYLRGTMDHGLIYKHATPDVLCFSDADWAGDQANRRSTSGMATLYSSGLVCYKAQQQSVVALSTTESEYISASISVKDLIWIRRFLRELRAPMMWRPLLLCDNQSAIRLIRNPEFHQRSKHIDIRYHFIRDSFESGEFDLEYLQTDQQLADLFTKSLASDRHHLLKEAIGCVSIKEIESDE